MHWIWRILGYTSKNARLPLAERSETCEKYANGSRDADESKLAKLRRLMRQWEVGIYLVLQQDEHESEHVAEKDKRVRYISNFTGSAGVVSVGTDWAELATDSRYYLIAERQLGPEFTLRKLGAPNIANWDDAVVEKAGLRQVNVGVDPKFIRSELATKIGEKLQVYGVKLVPIRLNLIDEVWNADRESPPPPLPPARVVSLNVLHTGKFAHEKVSEVRGDMRKMGVTSLVSYSLEDNAWLLNLRGGDVPYVPIFKCFLVITLTKVVLYADKLKLPSWIRDRQWHEGVDLVLKNYSAFFTEFSAGLQAGTVWVPLSGSWAIQQLVKEHPVKTDISPINLRKAIKNAAEISGIYQAQPKCSASIVKYLAWLNANIDQGITEYEGSRKLHEIRQEMPDFRGESFETISAVGANAAAPHYVPEKNGSAVISDQEIYLLDSGSQFLQGSTDITRTTHFGTPSTEEILAYTLVLKGQLAVSSLVFPEKTNGSRLDLLARQYLWEYGLDYGHGTGHGIGSYLNIHEMPLGIGITNSSAANLEPGHFVSDEPGYYKPGKFGIRLENDILVVESPKPNSEQKFCQFEITTLVPYEPKLINVDLLTVKERGIINAYHAQCAAVLSPFLTEDYEREYLARCCQSL